MNIHTFTLKIFAPVVILCSLSYNAAAQDIDQLAVSLHADISNAPAITIGWKRDADALSYQVYKRANQSEPWTLQKTLFGSATSFTDTTTVRGMTYEYQVLKAGQHITDRYIASGYLYTGTEVYPNVESRKVLLVIDESFKNTLAPEIMQFENDLAAEGWTVVKAYVARAENFNKAEVKNVKQVIINEYNRNKSLLKSVVIIGRVAVPYSGLINPDGHPDHLGAWPCDGYYAEMQEPLWSDNSIDNTLATRLSNKNIPGDGKFDQSEFPTPLELSVGRIDLYDMPDFKKSELELLKAYFQRNHDFRTGVLKVPARGMIDDNFGPLTNYYKDEFGQDTRYVESFASNAWRNFGPLVGEDSIFHRDYPTALDTAAYLWSYGCGGGGYHSATGVATTSQLASGSVNTIFTMLFGSYFGDWDIQNNFLRAPLCASPGALTSAWVGRPHWFFQRMGLGETIGQAELLSENNYNQQDAQQYLSTYIFKNNAKGEWTSENAKGSHMALMGDPTLVLQPLARDVTFKKLNVSIDTNRVILSWNINADTVVSGYFIYRAKSKSEPFTRLNNVVLKELSYTDTTAPDGDNLYMIHAVKLQISPSGSYFTSLASVTTESSIAGVEDENIRFKNISIQPNPVRDFAEISFKTSGFKKGEVEILDLSGNTVAQIHSGIFDAGENHFTWDLSDAADKRVPAGMYLLKITIGNNITSQKFLVMP
ncbi:MAG: T9SS type A sorting domain-containing protein [Bacteroidota bacterium]